MYVWNGGADGEWCQYVIAAGVGAGIGGSGAAFSNAPSKNTAYEYATCASSTAAAYSLCTTSLHTPMTRARCSASNVGAMCGLRSYTQPSEKNFMKLSDTLPRGEMLLQIQFP